MKIISGVFTSQEIKRKQHLIKILHLKTFKIIDYIPEGYSLYKMTYSIKEDEYERLKNYIGKSSFMEKHEKLTRESILDVLKGFGLTMKDFRPTNDRVFIPITCDTFRELITGYLESHPVFKGYYYFTNKDKNELVIIIDPNPYIV
ncbi:MAG: hypothetical protein ABSG25_04125 [Bryobacteraceae bacterium]